MDRRDRRANYSAIWALALAFGVIEASVAIYLREIYVRDASLGASSRLPNLEVTLVSLPEPLIALEIAREACTLILLAGVGWLSGRRFAERAGGFFLAFGIWDLAYYGVLWIVLGWPTRLTAWDVLFLIPIPWVAPMWAPAFVALLFVLAGSYLYWTPDYERRYGWTDATALAASGLLTLAAFLVESQAAVVHRVPERFPVWLYWSGLAIGIAWFVRYELSAAKSRRFSGS